MSCPYCACPRSASDAGGLAWSSEHVAGRSVRWICPGCTRTHLPEIETHLPLPGLDAAA